MTRAIPGWIHVEQDSPVGFNIVIPFLDFERALCDHGDRFGKDFFEPTCRPCQVNKSFVESEIDISWQNDFQGHTRRLFGRAENDQQKIALTRLLAIVRGDPEPLTLVEARRAGMLS